MGFVLLVGFLDGVGGVFLIITIINLFLSSERYQLYMYTEVYADQNPSLSC